MAVLNHCTGAQALRILRCCMAPIEAELSTASDDAAKEECAAENLPALYATLGHHLALISCRASAATGASDVKLSDVARALQNFSGRAAVWSGARIVEPSVPTVRRGRKLGVFLSRSGSAAEVEADRASGPQLCEPLRPAARLGRLSNLLPLLRSEELIPGLVFEGGCEGGLIGDAVSDSRHCPSPGHHAWAAATALSTAAPHHVVAAV